VEKTKTAAPQGDEASTQVPATPGQRGDQAKPASVVQQVGTEEQMNAVEQNEQGKEEAAAAAAEAVPSSEDHALVPAVPAPEAERRHAEKQKEKEKVREEGGKERAGGGRSSHDDGCHNQDREKEQPPRKQVRIEENQEMEGIQSERAVSRSSRHSASTESSDTRYRREWAGEVAQAFEDFNEKQLKTQEDFWAIHAAGTENLLASFRASSLTATAQPNQPPGVADPVPNREKRKIAHKCYARQFAGLGGKGFSGRRKEKRRGAFSVNA